MESTNYFALVLENLSNNYHFSILQIHMKSTNHFANGGALNARIAIWKENDAGYETLSKWLFILNKIGIMRAWQY